MTATLAARAAPFASCEPTRVERENVRLKRENDDLKARLQKVLGASRVATPRER